MTTHCALDTDYVNVELADVFPVGRMTLVIVLHQWTTALTLFHIRSVQIEVNAIVVHVNVIRHHFGMLENELNPIVISRTALVPTATQDNAYYSQNALSAIIDRKITRISVNINVTI